MLKNGFSSFLSEIEGKKIGEHHENSVGEMLWDNNVINWNEFVDYVYISIKMINNFLFLLFFVICSSNLFLSFLFFLRRPFRLHIELKTSIIFNKLCLIWLWVSVSLSSVVVHFDCVQLFVNDRVIDKFLKRKNE